MGKRPLFPENIPLKIGRFNDDLINAIKTGDIKTDLDAYKFALKRQCLPKHAADVLTQMMNKGQINSFKTTNSDIHRIKNIPQNIDYNETI